MNNLPSNEDLRVFTVVARLSSFIAAAEQLQVSTGYVSKRIRVLETALGMRLLHRTTRTVTVTQEGERIYHWAQRVLDDVEQLLQETAITRSVPSGTLRISSSFGFGRRVVAPLLSEMALRYPKLQVRLEVFDRVVDVASEGGDLDVRVGDEIAPHLIARPLARNHRILCASPQYLAERGQPRTLADLSQHDCLIIKERDHPFGVWKLRCGDEERVLKVRGSLSTNHGEIAVQWATDGRGIVLRSSWDVGPLIAQGKLQVVLPQWRQEANIWAVYPSRLTTSAKVRVCVEFLEAALADKNNLYVPHDL